MPPQAGDEVRHPLFARFYLRMAPMAEKAGTAEHRREALEGVHGRVIEVGAGSGLNFAYYPDTVTEVVAIEPEPLLREHARRAGATAAVPVTVLEGTASALPADPGSFDVAVVSLVLCSVPDQAAALAEIRRVLRPGGELRFYEHVVSDDPRMARAQRLLDLWLWPKVGGGCHCSRDTGAAIAAAGFDIEQVQRLHFQPSILMAFTAPHIVGRARPSGVS